MTISLVQAKPSDGTAIRSGGYVLTWPVTFDNQVTPGNLIVVVCNSYKASPFEIPTFYDNKGNTYQVDATSGELIAGGPNRTTIASALATIGGGGFKVTATSVSMHVWTMAIYELRGNWTSNWVDGVNTARGSSVTPSTGTSSPGVGNRYYVADVAISSVDNPTPTTPNDASWTQMNEEENGTYVLMNCCHLYSIGPKSLTWTTAPSHAYAAVIASYKDYYIEGYMTLTGVGTVSV